MGQDLECSNLSTFPPFFVSYFFYEIQLRLSFVKFERLDLSDFGGFSKKIRSYVCSHTYMCVLILLYMCPHSCCHLVSLQAVVGHFA